MARRFGRKSKKVEAEVESAPAVVDETTAVEQAAAVRLEGTVSGSVVLDDQGSGESDTGEALPGGMTWDQVNEAAEEQLAEAIAQTSSDGEGLEGSPEDAVTSAREGRYEWLTGGDDGKPPTPQEQVGDAGAAQGTGSSSGSGASVTADGGTAPVGGKNVFGQDVDFGAVPSANPLAGAPAQDPLTSFVDALEAKTGRDSGLTTPGDAKDTSPAFGKDAISEPRGPAVSGSGKTVTVRDPEAGTLVSNTLSDDGNIQVHIEEGVDEVGYYKDTTVTDYNNGTITTTHADGSYTTTKLDGAPVDSGGPLKDPGPDGEAPIPAEFQAQFDAEAARLRALRHQGPDSGDGATDPSEIESAVVGPAGDLPDHAQVGRDMFGQPATESESPGQGVAPNTGADSQGAGAITPGDDQTLPQGARRNDHPFDAAEPTPEPPAESDDSDTEGDDDGGELFVPGSEIVGPVDDPTDDVPDQIFDPSAP